MVKQVTESQYLQLVGLLTLASSTLTQLEQVESSINSLLKVDKRRDKKSGVGNPEHICDAVWSRHTADELLEKLGVAEAPKRKVAKRG